MLIVFGLTHPAVVLAAAVPGEDQGPDGDDHRPSHRRILGSGHVLPAAPPIHFLYKFPWTLAWLGSPGITSYGMIFGLEQTGQDPGHRIDIDADPV